MRKKYGILLLILMPFYFNSGCTKKNKVEEIVVLGTADLQGQMESYKDKNYLIGGIGRIATIINKEKKNHKNVIVVSTGDDLMNKFFHIFKGKAIFTLMSDAGYQVFAPGNHEFDKCPEIFSNALDSAKFVALCTDLSIENSPLKGKCKKIYIKEIGPVKIGFFSLMTEEFPMVTQGKTVKLSGDNFNEAEKAVKLLKDKGADIIIALTHIGEDKDKELAKKVSGIDLIFGGHSHEYLKKPLLVNNTLIVNGGEKGKYIVKIVLRVKNKRIISHDFKLISVDKSVKEEPLVAKKIAEYKKSFPKAIILGYTDKEWDLTKDAVRKGESGFADLVNDLMREKFKANIVLNNGGAFRGSKVYPAGKITDERLKEIDEFSNYAYMLKLKGKYIREILEWSAARYGTGGFLQVSGIRYKIDLRKKPMRLKKDRATPLHVDFKGERVKDIKVYDAKSGKWLDLDDEKEYKVVSNSFLVNKEGDGYFWFKRYGKELLNTYSTFYSIIADYVAENKKVNPPEPDGRIKIVK